MVWTNHGVKGIRHHPIHLHGHSFHVLKIGFGSYNQSTGEYLSENTDIHCRTQYCNQPQWKSSIAGGNDVPGLKTTKPIQKDTLMVPVGAYAVIRFKSDNPGKWFLHCHIEFHSMQGEMKQNKILKLSKMFARSRSGSKQTNSNNVNVNMLTGFPCCSPHLQSSTIAKGIFI